MLHVGVEDDPGVLDLCMVCPATDAQAEDADGLTTFVVILWEADRPDGRPGGVLRLCPLHADELLVLLSEAL